MNKQVITDNTTIGEIKNIIKEFYNIGITVYLDKDHLDDSSYRFYSHNIRPEMSFFDGSFEKIYDTLKYYQELNRKKILKDQIENLIQDEKVLEEVANILIERGILK